MHVSLRTPTRWGSLRPHEFEPHLEMIARRTIGFGAANFGVIALLTLLDTDNPMVVDAVVVCLAVLAFVSAAIWFTSAFWTSGRGAKSFGVFADIGTLAVMCTLRPVDALMTCVLFAVTGAFIMFYLPRRWLLAHIVLAAAATTSFAVWAVVDGAPISRVLPGADIVLAAVVGTTMTMQLAWATMRRRAESAGTDPLTGIRNLRGMWRDAIAMLAGAGRSGEVVAVAVADIDGFKLVNDTHGHDVGDEVLAVVASCLSEHIGDAGLVARSGGEEFTMLVRGTLDDVRARVGSIPTASPAGRLPTVNMSVGAALVDPCDRWAGREAAQEARRRADRIMYEVKRSGGDAVGVGF